MNKAAQQLGRMAAGVPKDFTPEDRERRRQLMNKINARKRNGDDRAGNSHDRRKARRAAK